jgi:hypothetical protein
MVGFESPNYSSFLTRRKGGPSIKHHKSFLPNDYSAVSVVHTSWPPLNLMPLVIFRKNNVALFWRPPYSAIQKLDDGLGQIGPTIILQEVSSLVEQEWPFRLRQEFLETVSISKRPRGCFLPLPVRFTGPFEPSLVDPGQ